MINNRRYELTLKMLDSILPSNSTIFDIGVKNPLSSLMIQRGHKVYNNNGEDLDDNFNFEIPKDVELVTGFEILEHLLSPYSLLKNLSSEKLFVTVPLRLWYSKSYRNKNDIRDCHFHEFEDWQFDWLLQKSGWNIKKREYWTNPSKKIGLRPILRFFSKRYYAVYAERK